MPGWSAPPPGPASDQTPTTEQPPAGAVPPPSPYGPAPHGQTPYGQAPADPASPPAYEQAPYGQAPYGQAPYGQAPYGQGPPAGYGPGAYQQAGAWGYGYVAPQNDKGSVTSLVLGIVGMLCCGIILGPAAIYEGVKARRRIAASNGTLTGDGMALAGIILGSVAVAFFVIGMIFFFATSRFSSNSTSP